MSHTASLELEGVIGFGGKVPNGLKWHPDGNHIVYPLGSTVVIKNLSDGKQSFLTGHTDLVTTVALSKCGKYIASGQKTNMGFKAPIILWSFDVGCVESGEKAAVHKLLLHKVAIQALDFSADSRFLASLGGQDDNSLVVWETDTGRAVCGTPAANAAAMVVQWYHGRSDKLVTGGQYHVRSWELQLERRRLVPTDVSIGSVKRIISSLALDDTDSRCYAGTSTGDILLIDLAATRFVAASPHRFSQGVIAMVALPSSPGSAHNTLLIGTGDGCLAKISGSDMKLQKAAEVMGAVTSIALDAGGDAAFIGTAGGSVYGCHTATMETQLRGTAHAAPISDVVFPEGTSELFITASGSDICIWNAAKRQELLRIQVPTLRCNCIAINRSGSSIVSGWDDGKIRAFAPESGRLQYAIPDAHTESVTAIALTSDGQRLVSGGKDGRVRVWNISGRTQVMEMSFKEHKKEVTSVQVSSNNLEAISSSADGSCLVWNLRRGIRSNALFASTVFRAIVYHPDESQLLTCGSDHKLTYWDTTDCTAIRIMDGSTAEITSVDIERDGVLFASGGLDRLVKLWSYDEGEPVATGFGHSGDISKVRISPDKRIIVSVGQEGAVFIWKMPSH